jgi:hypothetical protein
MSSPPDGIPLGPPIKPPASLAVNSAEVEEALKRSRDWRRRLFWARIRSRLVSALGAVIALVLVIGIALVVFLPHAGGLLLLILIAVLLNLAILGLARGARRFAWLGVGVFLSVPLFGGIVSVVRTSRDPKVQPVALIRKSDNVGLCGVYITENDKRVYLGRIEPKPNGDAIRGTGRIFWVRDDDVDMVKVGTLQPLRTANWRAPEMLAELYQDRAENPRTALEATATTTEETKSGKTTKTATEQPAKPPSEPSTRRSPHTVATSCTDVSLAKPKPGKPQRPIDDSDP